MRVRQRPLRPPIDRALPCLWATLKNFYANDALTYAGALAFFFLMAMFPLLILLASALAYIPVPDLFQHVTEVMTLIVPARATRPVQTVLEQVLQRDVALLSFGIAASIWIASTGFEAVINALDRVYRVPKQRSYWRKRVMSIGLTVLIGAMIIVALVAGLVGPLALSLLPSVLGADSLVLALLPYLRWAVILLFLALSIEILYFAGPSQRQSFRQQIPGALLAVGVWVVASLVLDFYMTHFTSYSRFYGVLGAVIALLIWFYVTALALLLGAELNAEMMRRKKGGTAWQLVI